MKYFITLPYYASVFVEVEAEDEEAAIELAIEKARPSLCHQCSHGIEIGEANSEIEPYAEEST